MSWHDVSFHKEDVKKVSTERRFREGELAGVDLTFLSIKLERESFFGTASGNFRQWKLKRFTSPSGKYLKEK